MWSCNISRFNDQEIVETFHENMLYKHVVYTTYYYCKFSDEHCIST